MLCASIEGAAYRLETIVEIAESVSSNKLYRKITTQKRGGKYK